MFNWEPVGSANSNLIYGVKRRSTVIVISFKDFCQTPDLGQGLEFDFTFAMEQQ